MSPLCLACAKCTSAIFKIKIFFNQHHYFKDLGIMITVENLKITC